MNDYLVWIRISDMKGVEIVYESSDDMSGYSAWDLSIKNLVEISTFPTIGLLCVF